MSIAQELPEISGFFVQECPLCGRPNRMTINGVYRDEKGSQRYPDMGYSFCNCKNIFYTRIENLKGNQTPNADPVERMKNLFPTMLPGQRARLVLPDPFFCEWGNDPQKTFLHWDPRAHWIIWDKEQFEEEMLAIGYEIVSSRREFDVFCESQQVFEIVVKKPVEGA